MWFSDTTILCYCKINYKILKFSDTALRIVWRYQRGNQIRISRKNRQAMAKRYQRGNQVRISRKNRQAMAKRYQRGNQIRISRKNRQSNGQKKNDKLRSTKLAYKTKDRITWTPLKTGDELRCSGKVSISCSTSDTRRVNLVANLVISHERGKDREVLTTSGTYPWSFGTQIFHTGQPSHGVDRKIF